MRDVFDATNDLEKSFQADSISDAGIRSIFFRRELWYWTTSSPKIYLVVLAIQLVRTVYQHGAETR